MKNKGIRFRRFPAAVLMVTMLLSAGPAALAETARLPGITGEMTEAAFWAEKTEAPDAVLADGDAIRALNAGFLACDDCRMTDMQEKVPVYDGTAFQRELLGQAMRDLSEYLGDGYCGADGQPVPYADMAAVFEAIEGARTSSGQEIRYGICVAPADVRAVPTEALITDTAGDNDFDALQVSGLRVNEPVLIRAETADGAWYYCDSVSISGWVPAADVAVCADRKAWLSAWDFPEKEALVVTEGRIYLDESNVNAGTSRRMLTMGTVLRRVSDKDYDAAATNRAAYQNYAVYLPVRDAEGKYGTTIALIPQHCGVSEGYLPLTAENVLNTAFSMLGDAYGWGGMLSAPDCSLYVRNVYKCFGLELPRNTVRQAAMPARKYPLGGLDGAEKSALLDELPAGTILFFDGHEMLYLGEEQGAHCVISAVGSVMGPDGKTPQRVRSVVVNTLEGTKRTGGNTWLEDLDLAVIPYLPEAPERTAGTVVEELVARYGRCGDREDGKVKALLAELNAMDRRQGGLWTGIMDYWSFVNTELTVNVESLPEDLPKDDSLCIVVLGFRLNDDGTMQQELIGRLTAALACAGQYPNAYVICTGGGSAKDAPDVTEAGLMGDWLLKHGLDENRLIIEDKSRSTAENAEFSCRILRRDYPQVDSAVIVSSSYHIARGSLLFEAAFLQSASEDQTPAIHVVSNCGFPIDNEDHPADSALRLEASGLLQLIGSDLAMQFLFDPGSVPEPAPSASPPAADRESVSPDYADEEMWAYYAVGEEKEADLFLICPTVDMNDEYNMSLDDADTMASFLGALNMERGIYEESARMFAPYYRQAAMKVYELGPEEREPYMALAYSDVSDAFSYYLENENRGRPIILAGFSQGADMCYRLLEEYFGDDDLYARLVAVYALGWPCTEELADRVPQIVPASAADDIGVVISFDCEAPDVAETFIFPAGQTAHAINPLNWRTDGSPAEKSENIGACFTDYSGEILQEEAGLCGCYIDEARGVLKVTDLDPADYPPVVPGLPEGAYHIYDYQFFYRNLQQNAAERLDAYLQSAALDQAA